MFYQQIIKGSIKFVILSMLEKQQMYGYGLIQTAYQKTKGFFQWRQSAVYTALGKMETCRAFKKKKVLFSNHKRKRTAYSKPNRMARFFKKHE